MKRKVFVKFYFLIFVSLTTLINGQMANCIPGKSDTLRLSSDLKFQFLYAYKDSNSNIGKVPDFTGYVAINDSVGYLVISSESNPGEIHVNKILLQNKQWYTDAHQKVDLKRNEVGRSKEFCSGLVTPWGTTIHGEETKELGDENNDDYDDVGWFVEVDPMMSEIPNKDSTHLGADKIYAMGRLKHENLCIKKDGQTYYFGADDKKYGYLYKFISPEKNNPYQGKLYVLTKKGNWQWHQVPNNTIEERNNTVELSEKVGAYNFKGIEDVEVSRIDDNVIYFTSKYKGVLYKLADQNNQIDVKVWVAAKKYIIEITKEKFINYRDLSDTLGLNIDHFEWEIKSENTKYQVAWHAGKTGNDNLLVLKDDRIVVLNDGGNNQIWLVDKTHSPHEPAIKLIGEVPYGYEPTGITCTPDEEYWFLSLQGKGSGKSQKDSYGNTIIWNSPVTLVFKVNN